MLVGLAPAGAPDLDWYAGMAESNVEDYGQADEDLAELTLNLKVRAEEARRDPMTLLDFLAPSCPTRTSGSSTTSRSAGC